MLVGVDHELPIGSDFVAHEADAAPIGGTIGADLHLEMRPSICERFATQTTDFVVGVPHPPDRSRVSRIPDPQQLSFAIGLRRRVSLQNRARLVGSERVGDVAEIDGGYQLRRRHVGEQLPQRLAFGFRVQIPDGIHDGSQRQMDDALLGAEPSQLRIAREQAPEPRKIGRDVGELPPDDKVTKCLDAGDTDLVAASDGECESVAFEIAIRPEYHVRRRVIRIDVHCVGSGVGVRGREPQVEDAQIPNSD